MEIYMKSPQESINASQVINWIKLVYPKKYRILFGENMYRVYSSFDVYICAIFDELDGVSLEIPGALNGYHYRTAISSIIIDLKKEFNRSDRLVKEVPSGPGRGVYYKYSLSFK